MFLKKRNIRRPISYCPSKEVYDLIHFLRTPLASIKTGAEIIREVLPVLLDAYEEKIRSIYISQRISDVKLKKLDCILKNILLEADRVSQYIDKIDC